MFPLSSDKEIIYLLNEEKIMYLGKDDTGNYDFR